MDTEITLKRFDLVKLLTTKNIKYLSAPPGQVASPSETWLIGGVVDGNKLILTGAETTIVVPATDVLLVAAYKLDEITSQLGRLSQHGKERKGRTNQG